MAATAAPTDTERERRRQEALELQQRAIDALTTSEGWQRWLTARSAFHRYSLHNQLLIALQDPEAIRAAGFKAWLKLGYCVRKGEKAVRIWAPMPPSKRERAEAKESGEKPRTRFRLSAVFTDRQVDPLPDFPGGPAPLRPPIIHVTGEDLEPVLPLVCDLCDSLGVTADLGADRPAGETAEGWYRPRERRLCVYGDQPVNARVATAVHELAHVLVRDDRQDDDPTLDYAAEEVVVESVAWTVTRALGIDTTGASAPYIASWLDGRPSDELHAHARLIDRLARRLEGALIPTPDTTTKKE